MAAKSLKRVRTTDSLGVVTRPIGPLNFSGTLSYKAHVKLHSCWLLILMEMCVWATKALGLVV